MNIVPPPGYLPNSTLEIEVDPSRYIFAVSLHTIYIFTLERYQQTPNVILFPHDI